MSASSSHQPTPRSGRRRSQTAAVPALVREGLNVESGLNDGMALPVFVIFLAAAAGQRTAYSEAQRVRPRADRQHRDRRGHRMGRRAPAVQVARCGLVRAAPGSRSSSSPSSWRPTAPASRSTAVASSAPGWPGSPSARACAASPRRGEPTFAASGRLAEQLADLLSSLSFFVFGAALLGPALQHFAWHDLAYAALSLTVIRMLPVALALLGSGLRFATVGYVGWFGPRGLASIVLGLLVLEEHIPGGLDARQCRRAHRGPQRARARRHRGAARPAGTPGGTRRRPPAPQASGKAAQWSPARPT